MNLKIIFNPFEKFNAKLLLFVGITFLVINIYASYLFGFLQNSIFHYGFVGKNSTFPDSVKISILSYLAGIVGLFVLGKIFNRKTRMIDITNAVLISQIPLAFSILIGGILFIKNILSPIEKLATENKIQELQNIPKMDIFIICCYTFVVIWCLIYGIILIYNGFRTATNIKKWQQIAIFIIVTYLLMVTTQLIIKL